MLSSCPLISVIVPVYNVEDYLEKSVKSILAQTYDNLEIILVDDGSTDSSGSLCDAYAEKDSRIKVIHKENGGVSSARNAGLDAARGELVGFVDSDDTALPNMFERLLQNMKDTGSDISICNIFYCGAQEGDGAKDTGEEKFMTFSAEDAISAMLMRKHFTSSVYNKLFSADLLCDVRFEESIHIGEDLLFCTKAIAKSKKLCLRSGRYYNYYVRASGAMRSIVGEKHTTVYTAHLMISDYLRERGLGHLTKFVDTSIIMTSMKLLRRIYIGKDIQKKYCNFFKTCLKKHLNKESFALLTKGVKFRALIVAVSWRLYFLIMKIVKN